MWWIWTEKGFKQVLFIKLEKLEKKIDFEFKLNSIKNQDPTCSKAFDDLEPDMDIFWMENIECVHMIRDHIHKNIWNQMNKQFAPIQEHECDWNPRLQQQEDWFYWYIAIC